MMNFCRGILTAKWAEGAKKFEAGDSHFADDCLLLAPGAILHIIRIEFVSFPIGLQKGGNDGS
jgi:hypothetical protein